jgi:hypothetical protein
MMRTDIIKDLRSASITSTAWGHLMLVAADALEAVRLECQEHRNDYAPDEPKERDLLEAIEAIVGRDMS